jgi:Zn-dependent hydrolases, including glyoxylases
MRVDYIVNSVFTSRTYIVSSEKTQQCVIVDVGDVEPLMEYLNNNQLKVMSLLLTHAHFDHIYGLPDLLKVYPNLPIYTNAFGVEALGNERVNMSRYHEMPINYRGDNVRVVSEGNRIPLFEEMEAICYETPGHNPSCLTFEIGDYLFTGDAFIPGVAVVTNLPKGDKALAEQSLKRIQLLASDKTVCPGHEIEGFAEI